MAVAGDDDSGVLPNRNGSAPTSTDVDRTVIVKSDCTVTILVTHQGTDQCAVRRTFPELFRRKKVPNKNALMYQVARMTTLGSATNRLASARCAALAPPRRANHAATLPA